MAMHQLEIKVMHWEAFTKPKFILRSATTMANDGKSYIP